MANLKLLLCIVMLVVAAPAQAVPLIAIAASYAASVGWIAGWVAAAISVGATLIQSAQTRRKQKRAEAAQRAAYNASLQDRTVNLVSSEPPWQIVYGSPAPFAGAIVACFTSGSRDQYKHLVIVFAAHECQAIDEIYLDGDAVGTLGPTGWVTGGTFLEYSNDRHEIGTISFDANGQATLSGIVVTNVHIAYRRRDDAPPFVGGIDFYDQSHYEWFVLSWSYDSNTNITTLSNGPISKSDVFVDYQARTAAPRVNVQKHLSPGGVDTADSFLISQVPSKWTTAHKLSGFTYIVLTVDLDMPRFQNGPPQVTAKMRGKKLYDWRTSTTAYSTNPVLARGDFIMGAYGFGASLAQIESASAIASANACDAAVYSAGDQTAGTTVRYSCDGVFNTDQDREITLQQLEDVCLGTTHESGGVWRMMAGYWAPPVMTLTDADAHGAVTVAQASFSSRERFNGCRGTYCDWRFLGVSTDFKPYVNSTFLASDGVARDDNIGLPFTNAHQRAQHIARVRVEQSRGGLVLRYPGHMRLWPLQPGDRVTLTYSEFSISAKNFRVADWGFSLTSPVSLELIEDEESFYDLADETTVDAAPNTGLPNPFARPDAPANLAASAGTNELLQQGNTFLPRVFVSWDQSTNQSVVNGGSTEVRWGLVGDPEQTYVSTTLDPTETSTYLTGMSEGQYLLVQVRFVTSVRAAGDWSTIVVYVLGKTEPPGVPTQVSLTQELVFFRLPDDIDVAGVRIRSLPGNVAAPVFSRGTDVVEGLVLASPVRMERKLYGIQTVMVVAEDTTGNQSEPAFAVLDFGTPDTDDAVWDRNFAAESFPGTYTDCALSGGVVQADLDPADDLYTLDNVYGEPDVYATLYLAMTWQADMVITPYAGTLITDYTAAGNAVTVEYRVSGNSSSDLYAESDVYALSNVYGSPAEWSQWPGALDVPRLQPIDFRVSIGPGSERGEISAFTVSLVMEDVAQVFTNMTVDAGGTRLTPSDGTPARNWIGEITGVYGTPAVDGSGAIALRVLDYSPELGPLVEFVDITGTAVTARGSIKVEGNSDD